MHSVSEGRRGVNSNNLLIGCVDENMKFMGYSREYDGPYVPLGIAGLRMRERMVFGHLVVG